MNNQLIEGEDARPLYRQIYERLRAQIAEPLWDPGEALPSERLLAEQCGVSQGTMRKAIDALVADQLLERRQGKGTFIVKETQERALFRFFRMVRIEDGRRVTPTIGAAQARRRAAQAADRAALGLDRDATVIEIKRTRLLDGRPCIAETIIVPEALFPGLEARMLPNALYALYLSDYRVRILEGREQLGAAPASADEAAQLGTVIGYPLLEIDRIALSFEERPVEWRISRCLTLAHRYAVTLR